MCRLIAKLLGLPKEHLNVGSSGQGGRASTRPPAESSGVPEDDPIPKQPAAEPPALAASDQDEVEPVRLPFPVPAPSRNGTHAHADH